MTDRTTDRATPDGPPDPDASAAGHLVCAYSPRWLSGPSSYEGLVATFSPGSDDDPDAEVATPGSSA
jgi:hypothetical protein